MLYPEEKARAACKNNTIEMVLSVRKWDANDACEEALGQSVQNKITNRFNQHNPQRHTHTVTWAVGVCMRHFIHENWHILKISKNDEWNEKTHPLFYKNVKKTHTHSTTKHNFKHI